MRLLATSSLLLVFALSLATSNILKDPEQETAAVVVRVEPLRPQSEHNELVLLRRVVKGGHLLRRLMGARPFQDRALQVRRPVGRHWSHSSSELWLGLDSELRVLWERWDDLTPISSSSSHDGGQTCLWTAFDTLCPRGWTRDKKMSRSTDDEECQHFPCHLFVDVLTSALGPDAPSHFFKPDRRAFGFRSDEKSVRKKEEDSYLLLPFASAFKQPMDSDDIALLTTFVADLNLTQGIVVSLTGREANVSSSISLEVGSDASVMLRVVSFDGQCEERIGIATQAQLGVDVALRLSKSGWLEVFDRCTLRLTRRLLCPLVLDADPDLVVGFMFRVNDVKYLRGELRELILLNGFDDWNRLNRRCSTQET